LRKQEQEQQAPAAVTIYPPTPTPTADQVAAKYATQAEPEQAAYYEEEEQGEEQSEDFLSYTDGNESPSATFPIFKNGQQIG
jgi:hypothetical protein